MDRRILFTLGLAGVAAAAALARSARPAQAPGAAFEVTRAPALRRSAPDALRSPQVAPLVVYVTGDVGRPGVYTLPAGSRAERAVRAAGGLRSDADSVAVNLAARLEDGEEIAVPVRGERVAGQRVNRSLKAARPNRRQSRRLHGAAGGRRAQKTPDQPVDLNSADVATLETLPGVGSALAERIVEFRETNGPFSSLDDLLDVAGTSPRLIDELAPYALVGGR